MDCMNLEPIEAEECKYWEEYECEDGDTIYVKGEKDEACVLR